MRERNPTPARKLSRAALAFRAFHAAIAVEMLLAIAYVWWCALSGRRDRLLLRMAATSLIGEGILVAANHGDCPLGGLQERLGDPVPLFELVLSPRAAKRAVPSLGAITAVGLVLLVARGRHEARQEVKKAMRWLFAAAASVTGTLRGFLPSSPGQGSPGYVRRPVEVGLALVSRRRALGPNPGLWRISQRGMKVPELAVGDGVLGFWAAIRDVFPEARSQRDWKHKSRNVLNSMPKSVYSRAKAAIKEITCAENKKEAIKAIEAFAKEFGVKWPKAIEKISSDKEALLTFHDYPAEHWRHLRTTNPVESVFAPVRARTDITRGAGSRQAASAMIYKLIEAAQGRWRKLTGAHLVALVRAGAKFRNGELVEGREEKVAA